MASIRYHRSDRAVQEIVKVAIEELGARAHSTLARKVLIVANLALRGLPLKK